MSRTKRKVIQQRASATFTDERPVTAGRASLDAASTSAMGGSFRTIFPPSDHESYWRIMDVDTNNLDRWSPKQLLDMLMDVSPDISAAAWQFQRLCNPGYECKVYELGSDTVESKAGKDHISNFISRLRDMYGSFDIIVGRFFMGGFLRGALCSELVLDGEARESVDFVAPDPFYILFRKQKDSLRGDVWEPVQWQDGKVVSLNIPTFKYLPIDPAPASPYGRSLAAPALFTAIFLLSLLHDIKRVIMQQGYKRMDISLNTQMAEDNFNYDPQGAASFSAYLRAAIDQIKYVYSRLQPDDAFIHTDLFDINLPTGTVDLDSIGAIDKLIERLEKQITRALKSNGVVMDTSNNSNESDSNRKWEIFAAGIKALQHLCENMIEAQFSTSLKAVGIQARVVFRFAEMRAAELLRDEQAKAMRISNANAMYDSGYSSQDEASNYAVNHNADVPEPRMATKPLDLVEDDSSGNELLKDGRYTWQVVPIAK